VPIAVAIFAAIAIAGMARLQARVTATPVAVPPTPAQVSERAPVAAASRASVTALRSRLLGTATVEIWGTTTAPTGASVRLRVRAVGGRSVALPDAPVVSGRFYAKTALPAGLSGRRVTIGAHIRS
jgi:hypothetical protein